jgi:hypothetical protein
MILPSFGITKRRLNHKLHCNKVLFVLLILIESVEILHI